MKKLIIAGIILVLAAAGAAYFFVSKKEDTPAPTPETAIRVIDQNTTPIDPDAFDKEEFSTTEPRSLWVIVNKTNPLELDYVPSNLRQVDVTRRTDKSAEELSLREEAAEAMEKMFPAAEAEGIKLLFSSGYRSAELQARYYNTYVATYGQAEADTFSAQPGSSEHQTGFGVDVNAESRECYLEICFADMPEGKWLAAHAHEYGFIIRYPLGKEAITGYQYEPWHLRYVGVDLAKEIHESQMTLEEFFEVTE